jgi:hypothetical protein
MHTDIPHEEDLMVNRFQEFALVLMISAIGLFTASHAIGQESTVRKADPATTANVLPPLYISDESLEPNLNGMLATGDGGAMIEIKEITGNLPQASTASRQSRK